MSHTHAHAHLRQHMHTLNARRENGIEKERKRRDSQGTGGAEQRQAGIAPQVWPFRIFNGRLSRAFLALFSLFLFFALVRLDYYLRVFSVLFCHIHDLLSA